MRIYNNKSRNPNLSIGFSALRPLLILLLLLTSTFYQQSYAAGPTFVCDGDAYLSADNIIDKFDSATLSIIPSEQISVANGLGVNALGFNILDNYIYGVIETATGVYEVMQLASDGTYTLLGDPVGSQAWNSGNNEIRISSGTVDTAGYWYVVNTTRSRLFKVFIGTNPSPGSLTFEIIPLTGANLKAVTDLTFNPLDGHLYAATDNVLQQITTAGVVSNVATTGDTLQTGGGAWADAAGFLYFYRNVSNGRLFRVDMNVSPPVVDLIDNPYPTYTSFDATACTPPTLSKAVSSYTASADEVFTYTFTVSNPLSGPLTANFSDSLPDGLRFISGSLSPAAPGGGTVTTFDSDTLIIENMTIPAGLPPANELTFTVQAMATNNVPLVASNTAQLSFGPSTIDSDDPNSPDGGPTTITIQPYNIGPTYVCDGDAYLSGGNFVDKLDSGTMTINPADRVSVANGLEINATGYNILDNYIYGIISIGGEPEIMQLASDGTYTLLGDPVDATGNNTPWGLIRSSAGTMDSDGNWYVLSEDRNYLYKVFIGSHPSPGSLTFEKIATSSTAPTLSDITFNPLDGHLYGASGNKLYRITTAGVPSLVTKTGVKLNTAGGAWANSDGFLFFYANTFDTNSGRRLYSVDMNASTPVVALLPGVYPLYSSFDATACTPPSLSKSLASSTAAAGEVFTYTFKANNPLASPLTVGFADHLSAGLSFVSDSLSPAAPGGGSVTTFDDNTLIIENMVIPAGVSPANMLEFTVQVVADANILVPVAVPNTAQLTFGTTVLESQDPDTGEGGPTVITINPNDWGDAPFSLSSVNPSLTNTYGEAKHMIDSAVYLGSLIDADLSGQNMGPLADGDDNDGSNDDDGVTFPIIEGMPGLRSSTSNILSIEASVDGFLNAWIDWNQDGVWNNTDEMVATNLPLTAGANSLDLIPSSLYPAGDTYIRFRFTSESVTTPSATDPMPDGEVEDYLVRVVSPTVSGRVFVDTNSDAVNDASETGINNTVVVLLDTTSGDCVSTETNASGEYAFAGVAIGSYQVYQAHGETTPIPQNCAVASQVNPTGYQSTTTDVYDISVLYDDILDQDFGEIAGIQFRPNHQGQVIPGNTVSYSHIVTTNADGAVSFTTSSSGNVSTGWSSVIYQDDDCDGVLSAAESSSTIGASTNLLAGEQLCIIHKVNSANNVVPYDKYSVEIAATFSYLGGALSPSVMTVKDDTTASQGKGRLELSKSIENLTQGTAETTTSSYSKPGDTLKYRIYYSNTGEGNITDLVINDTVPTFTTLDGGTVMCEQTPPLMSCTPVVSTDALTWQFTGDLTANSEGFVSYSVTIDDN